MRRYICICMIVCFSTLVSADNSPDDFYNLATLKIDSLGEYFDNISIHFDKSITSIIDTTYYDMDRGRALEEFGLNHRLIITRIDRRDDTLYTIDFSPGPSVDPNFRIFRNTDKGLQRMIRPGIGGIRLIVPGDGHIYVSGHTNNTFDQRRIYRVEGDEIIEVNQPFYYVGLESVTNREIKLSDTFGLL